MSIIRFRTAIKEPEEISYLFICIGIGLGLGAGYKLITIDNSPTNAGGTAIYASDGLKCSPRSDIKFNYPNCEACFVEVECDIPGPSPIFGALYRHPGHEAHSFCSHLGDFLELFAERGVKLTVLGDINIDLSAA